jgi:hypothetical protein
MKGATSYFRKGYGNNLTKYLKTGSQGRGVDGDSEELVHADGGGSEGLGEEAC